MYQKKGFTLIELLIAMTIFVIVITLVIQFFLQMVQVKRGLEGKQYLIENSYYLLETIQIQMKNYTIDYEEYFNRRSVGCDSQPNTDLQNFVRDVGSNGYCDRFTAYGNQNSIGGGVATNHELYYCSSSLLGNELTPVPIISSITNLRSGKGCFEDLSLLGASDGKKSFGQYANQFFDVNQDVDTVTGSYNDGDDEPIGMGPVALGNATGVQELYLVSQNKQNRFFLRRALVESGDYNQNGTVGDIDSENLYTLQMLKLKGYDIGSDHDLINPNNSGLYDGQIDTRACDVVQGFFCTGISPGSFYANYNLPADQDDGWLQLFSKTITIPYRNIEVFPNKDPSLARGEDDMQISPYMTISFQSKLYGDGWFKTIGARSIDAYTVSLQTSFAINSFYGK